MTRPWARDVRTVAAPVVALPLAACTSAAGGDARTPAATAAAASAPTSPCPVLEPVAPRADGLADLELPCLGDGPAVRPSDLRGVPTVVNFWAAWCINCDREMPLADAVERAGDDVRLFGFRYKATRDQGLQSEADFGVPVPSVPDEDGDLVVQQLRAHEPPQTVLVPADGRVAGREIGEITSRRELTQLVERYLGVDL